MKFRLSNQARLDLRQAYRYSVKTFGVDQADRYLLRLYDTFELLCSQSEAGHLADIDSFPKMRKILSDKHNVFYDPTYDFIAIFRIFHTARQVDENDIEPFQ